MTRKKCNRDKNLFKNWDKCWNKKSVYKRNLRFSAHHKFFFPLGIHLCEAAANPWQLLMMMMMMINHHQELSD